MERIVKAARIIVDPGRPDLDCQALAQAGGAVLAVGQARELSAEFGFEVHDFGGRTLVPMAVNSHCHLELAHLLGKIDPGLGFPGWVRAMIKNSSRSFPDEQAAQAVRKIAGKTCVLADTATNHPKDTARVIMDSGLFFVLFPESINKTDMAASHEPGFRSNGDGEYGMYAGCGHALYSTAPEILKKAKQAANARNMPFSMHLAEHEHELEAIGHGRGEFARMLAKAGMLQTHGPDRTPVEIADSLGLVDENTLLVHCVHLTDSDIELVANKKVSVCLCPRSNEFIGVGRARWEDLMDAGVNLCLGTDSPASNTDIDVWNEVLFLADHLNKDISLHNLVAMVTTNPARVLGLHGRFGRLLPGYRARYCSLPQELENCPG